MQIASRSGSFNTFNFMADKKKAVAAMTHALVYLSRMKSKFCLAVNSYGALT